MEKRTRKSVPIELQLDVYFRDKWLCHICRRPLIFPFALKHIAELVARSGAPIVPAYYNVNWRRDSAPLLDELGASIDHVHAFAKGGAHDADNFAAICARCNARKSTSSREDFILASQPWRVKGKYGEPGEWDGLTSLFVTLAGTCARPLTPTEQKWLNGLRARLRWTDSQPRQ